ncbi:MAG: hypothetical protein L0Y54_04395 [Sporichthyaceae bacterium]|nr:hypothetical protein [Sporichthyaceae bacterium]
MSEQTYDRRNTKIRIAVFTTAVLAAIALAFAMVSCEQRATGDVSGLTLPSPTVDWSQHTPTPVSTPTEDAESGSPNGTEQDGSGGQEGGSDGSDGNDGDPDGGEEGGGMVEELEPAAEDCVGYDPTKLATKDLGDDGWGLAAGGISLLAYATKADAMDAVKVARNHTELCFIGRGNDRPNKWAYLTTYFAGESGLPLGAAPVLDCVSYQASGLALLDIGDDGWRLEVDGDPLPLLRFDTKAQALLAHQVASSHTKLCFINQHNDRPNPFRYIHEFWRD